MDTEFTANPRGHQAHGKVTVHCDDRNTHILLGHPRHTIDPRAVRRVCSDLRTQPSQLPGAKSRV